MLNHQGEYVKENLTPRNACVELFFKEEEKREGGRNMCATLFTSNLDSLSLEQASFLSDLGNWNPTDTDIGDISNELSYDEKCVMCFRQRFAKLINSKTSSSWIRMMDNREDENEEKICYKPKL